MYITISQDRHRASQDRQREGCRRRGGLLKAGDCGVQKQAPVHQNQLALAKWLHSSRFGGGGAGVTPALVFTVFGETPLNKVDSCKV